MHRRNSDDLPDEVSRFISQQVRVVLDDMGNATPDYIDIGFAAYTFLIPELFNVISRNLANALPQAPMIVGPVWNYLDAACAAMVGVSQLVDRENHRQLATKTKGLLNLSSFIQLTTLTALSFSALGGPSFAIAFGIAFASSLDDSLRAARRRYDFTYWLEDSLSELERINQLLEEMQIKNDKEKTGLSKWLAKQKMKHMKMLSDKKKEIEKEVLYRTVYRLHHAKEHDNDLTVIRNNVAKYHYKSAGTQKFFNAVRAITSAEPGPDFFSSLKGARIAADYGINFSIDNCIENEKASVKKCDDQFKETVFNSAVLGIACVGMVLLCFPVPGSQIAGLALIGLSSAIFIAKNFKALATGVNHTYHWAEASLFRVKKPMREQKAHHLGMATTAFKFIKC